MEKRRPLVGQLGLAADDGERAGEAELAQRDRRLGAAMAAADDQDIEPSHRAGARSPSRVGISSETVGWIGTARCSTG